MDRVLDGFVLCSAVFHVQVVCCLVATISHCQAVSGSRGIDNIYSLRHGSGSQGLYLLLQSTIISIIIITVSSQSNRMPPKESWRGGRGNWSSSSGQHRPNSSETPQAETSSSYPESSPSDSTSATGGPTQSTAGPAQQTPSAVEEGGNHGVQELDIDLYASSPGHGTSNVQDDNNVSNPGDAGRSHDPQPTEARASQPEDTHGGDEFTPPRQRWAPVPQNTPEAPSQTGGVDSSSPTHTSAPRAVLEDSGTSPETPSPQSYTSTPPAPGAGDGPRYESGRNSGSPVGRRSPDPVHPSPIGTPSASTDPASDEASDAARVAQNPDFPRASVESENVAVSEETEAREDGGEEIRDTE